MIFFEKMRFYFRLWGIKGGIGFFMKLLCDGSEKVYSMELDSQNQDKLKPDDFGLEFHLIDDCKSYDAISVEYAKIKGEGLVRKDRDRVVAAKEYIAVIYRNNCLAGWGWVKKGPLVYCNFSLMEHDCVIHKCRTLRNHRRKGVYAFLLEQLKFVLRERGFRKVYISSKSFNKASLGGIEKAGFRFIGEYNPGSYIHRLLRKVFNLNAD
ncbi:MAG: GNAT family N-acetyltransferase [Phycisphaerae bacterium]|jgi:GNAT superfamily N-acetyltransferase